MQSVVRAGLLAGLLIVVVDVLAHMLSRGSADDLNRQAFIWVVDNLVDIMIATTIAERVGRATRMVRPAAEVGVLAGAIAAAGALTTAALWPLGPNASLDPSAIIFNVAFNIAVGGVAGIAGGWTGSRSAARLQ
ncbi:MAG: hypothetical protein IT307_19710 [Chloroflexi bacterium]|nr:hypothetical protein [Chloroflexota bacterium]